MNDTNEVKEKDSRKKNLLYIIAFGILFLTVLIVASYAYFGVGTFVNNVNSNISARVDCLNITYTEVNNTVINLQNQYPITDDYALSHLTPVTVNVTNNCTTNPEPLDYVLTYTSLSQNSGYIPDSKMRIKVNRKLNTAPERTLIKTKYVNSLEALTHGSTYTLLVNDLATRQNVSTYPNKVNYVIDRAKIDNGETNTYKVYLWIDYYEGDTTHTGLNDNTTEGLDYKAALSLVLNSENVHIPASESIIALQPSNSSKITQYSGPVTDECDADSCTTEDNAQNVFVVTSNDINNVIFEGYCWKIIRTTETGGVKLLYNGLPSNGECTANRESVVLTATQMNTTSNKITYSQGGAYNKPAYIGYMYNPNTLTGTYKQQLRGDATYDLNTNDSLLKEKIEYWFSNSNIDETKLEDAVYCNDRSLDSTSEVSEVQLENYTGGNSVVRFKNYNTSHYTLECTLITDSFNTTNTKAQTNYKVGFMTEPERYLIGASAANINIGYSALSQYYWLGSPNTFSGSAPFILTVQDSGGRWNNGSTDNSYYVRPVISASSNVHITSGTGSTTDPFIFE